MTPSFLVSTGHCPNFFVRCVRHSLICPSYFLFYISTWSSDFLHLFLLLEVSHPSPCCARTHLTMSFLWTRTKPCLFFFTYWLSTPQLKFPLFCDLHKAFTYSILFAFFHTVRTYMNVNYNALVRYVCFSKNNAFFISSKILANFNPQSLKYLTYDMHSVDTALQSVQFSSVQSLSRVRLFVTPWTAAHQASLSITNSWSSFKLLSIKSEMPSNQLILCHPLLLLPSIFPRYCTAYLLNIPAPNSLPYSSTILWKYSFDSPANTSLTHLYDSDIYKSSHCFLSSFKWTGNKNNWLDDH